MNTQNTLGGPGPLTGIIKFLAIIGLLAIFAFGGFAGIFVYLFLTTR